MTKTEEWRDIPGAEGRYQASSLGRIRATATFHRSGKHTILKDGLARGGYRKISLAYTRGTSQSRAVHHLVMEAFVGVRPEGMVVNHLDYNRANNRLDNLEYITAKENIAHSQERRMLAIRNSPNYGLKKGENHWSYKHPEKIVRGEKCGSAKLTDALASKIKQLYREGVRPFEVKEMFGLTNNIVYSIFYGRSWKHVP